MQIAKYLYYELALYVCNIISGVENRKTEMGFFYRTQNLNSSIRTRTTLTTALATI